MASVGPKPSTVESCIKHICVIFICILRCELGNSSGFLSLFSVLREGVSIYLSRNFIIYFYQILPLQASPLLQNSQLFRNFAIHPYQILTS